MSRTFLFLTAICSCSLVAADSIDVDKMSSQVKQLESVCEDLEVLESLGDAINKENSGHEKQAMDVYKKLLRKYPHSPKLAEAHYRLGCMYARNRQFSDAFEHFDTIIKMYPNYDKFERVLDKQFEIASSLMKGMRPMYYGLIPGFKDYDSAMDYFKMIASSAPNSKYAPEAWLCRAKLAQKHGEKADAIDSLEHVVDEYPKTSQAADAYLLLGQIYMSLVYGPQYDQGSTKKAIECFKNLLALHPDSKNVKKTEEELRKSSECLAKSRFEIGEYYYYAQYNPRAAAVAYSEAISTAPRSKIAVDAKKRLALIEKGAPPPRLWIDRIFGFKKHRPANEEYIDYAKLERIATEKSEVSVDKKPAPPAAKITGTKE